MREIDELSLDSMPSGPDDMPSRVTSHEAPEFAEYGRLSRSRFLAQAGAFLLVVALVGRFKERAAWAHGGSPPCGCSPSPACSCCGSDGSCCSSGSQKCMRRFNDCNAPSGFWIGCCNHQQVQCIDYTDSDGSNCICGYYIQGSSC
jgi:hypothetical protein